MKVVRHACWILLIVTVFFAFNGVDNAFSMELTVVTSVAKTVTVQAEPEDTVADVKEFVYNVIEIHPGNQRMFKGDIELDNAMTLASYGITDGDTLKVSYGRSTFSPQDNGKGGLIKVIVIIVILAVIITIIKKVLMSSPEN